MEKRRIRHGLAVAGVVVFVVAAAAALLYGLFVLGATLYLEGWEL
ncbi:MAG TPA: hypothetical protein VHN37_02160 [Actinomycetota bacterium]|nr:hypothetical protein [Actinomycetota bacterium]